MTKVVTLMHDDSPENPNTHDGWKLYSFCRRHCSYKDPDYFNPDEDPDLKAKLENGFAFWLSYSEHGNCEWALSGQGWSDPWDSVERAGILIWEMKEDDIGGDRDKKQKDAEMFCARYTCWCNGEVYGYRVMERTTCPHCGQTKDEDIEDASCFGYYGDDIEFMSEEVRRYVNGDPEVIIRGDADYLADHHDFGQKKRRTA